MGPEGRGLLVASTLRWALALLAVLALLVGVVQFAVIARGAPGVGTAWAAELLPAAGLVYVAAGVVAWGRRPSNRLGTIIVVGGLAMFVSALENFSEPVLAAIGTVLQTVVLAVVVHLLLAFPSGQLRSRVALLTVIAGYFTCLVLQIPLYLFHPQASPSGMLSTGDHPALFMAGMWLQIGTGIVVVLTAATILADRLRKAAPGRSRVLGPLYLYGILAVMAIPLLPEAIAPLTGLSPAAAGGLQVGVLMGIPLVFATVLLVGGFARTGEIQELGAWLTAVGPARPSLEHALAWALGDDSLELGYFVADGRGCVDGGGKALELPAPGSGRRHIEISLGDRRIGAVIYDDTLIADPALVEAAGRVVAVAMDHDRLTAELLASREQLHESRARLVEASDRERRRIAENLHDGLQMNLVLLGLEAQQLGSQPGASEAVVRAAIALRSGIDRAAAELRQLVHDVMPAPLIEGGLGPAVQDLVDRLPFPVRASLDVNGSLSGPVSSAAYFVVAEALANAIKHAQATTLAVHLSEGDGLLRVEVRDDGIGGVAPGEGLGLYSLADRVDALGGRLSIHSPPGRGTHVFAELPCGS